MPTPARLATASRLASGPPALNTVLAAASTRSRLRTASARGLRAVSVACFVIPLARITNRLHRPARRFIPLTGNDLSKRQLARSESSCFAPLKTEDASAYGL